MSSYEDCSSLLSNNESCIFVLCQLFKRRNVELINEDASMFDSLLVDSYVSSTTCGVRCLSFLQLCCQIDLVLWTA